MVGVEGGVVVVGVVAAILSYLLTKQILLSNSEN
jgi:hypothetical protein